MDAVRAQTCPDSEFIFVNDCSPDDSAAILAAAVGTDPRIRVVTLPENRGLSGARNAGLDVARGEYIFFADPDDLIDPTMLEKGVRAMDATGADYCVWPYREQCDGDPAPRLVPLKGPCDYATNDEILERHLSRMFGYSFDHVRAWYAGEGLFSHRIQGSVCWCAYRRDVIEAHHVRFDERVRLYEDAVFNGAYLIHARTMTHLDEPLYDYVHGRGGMMSSRRRCATEVANKLALLRARREIDSASGGRLAPMYAASCVFSVLEMLSIVLTFRAPLREGLRHVREYLADDAVRRAVAGFPLSARRPMLALSVLALRAALPFLGGGRT